MKKYFVTAVLVFGIFGGNARAEEGAVIKPIGPEAASLDGYDIDQVVDAVVKGMSDKARNYYLPDDPGNTKAIKRYGKDARKAVMMSTAFKRELAQVCVDVANNAASAGGDAEKLPGQPLETPMGLPPVPLGVSSKTVTTEGGVTVVYTNTMPCIDAAARSMHSATLSQFPNTAADSAAKKVYTRRFGNILTANRLYNHLLAEVCSQLVELAKKYSEQNRRSAP